MDNTPNLPSLSVENIRVDRSGTVTRFAEFATLRSVAMAEWVGGTVGGNTLHETFGTNRWALAGCVTISVAILDYPQSRWAARRQKNDDLVHPSTLGVLTEAGALLSSAWNGAGPTVEYNNSAGISTTRARSAFQGLTYGAAVGLWSSPVPVFRHLGDKATDAVKSAVENPISYGLTGLSFSAAMFGIFRGIRHLRQRRQKN